MFKGLAPTHPNQRTLSFPSHRAHTRSFRSLLSIAPSSQPAIPTNISRPTLSLSLSLSLGQYVGLQQQLSGSRAGLSQHFPQAQAAVGFYSLPSQLRGYPGHKHINDTLGAA